MNKRYALFLFALAGLLLFNLQSRAEETAPVAQEQAAAPEDGSAPMNADMNAVEPPAASPENSSGESAPAEPAPEQAAPAEAPAASEPVTEPAADQAAPVAAPETAPAVVPAAAQEATPPPPPPPPTGPMHRAVAQIVGLKDPDVKNTAEFTETIEGLLVSIKLVGFPQGIHGIHIHEKGSCDNMGEAAGGHFNPDGVKHGFLPNNGLENAHPGDMGNITVSREGKGVLRVVLPGVNISSGKYNVANKALIIHQNEDDFSQPTGNAGDRLACGVIEPFKQ